MNYKSFVFILLYTFAFQTVTAEKRPLTLDQAIENALQNNFDILIQQAEKDMAVNNNRLGNAGFLPDLTLLFGQSNRFVDADNPASFLDGKYRNITGDGRLDLNWTLFNGFRAHISKSKLNLLEEQSAGFVTVVIENTIQAVILSYFQTWIEQEKLSTLEELLALSKDRLEFVELQRKIGSASTFDYLQVKNNFIADSTYYARQQLLLKRSLRDLMLLMRAQENQDFELTDEPVLIDERFSKSELENLLLSNNMNLRNQYIQQEIFQKNISIERSSRYPRLSMNAGTSYTINDFQLENNPSTTGRTFDYYINFSLSFNLFNGGNITRQIQNAKIMEHIAGLEVSDIEQNVKLNFFNTFDNYEMLWELTALSELNKDNTRNLLELAEERYRSGTISSFDYRIVQIDFLNATLTYFESLLELKATEVELLRITGGLIDENPF